ncbi:DUF4893 domain-containing protein [Loktanella sp. R86503]|uniref:DUF4893 domain-containing protein n=1 Tax=Loktanella sp. R86503 TaxID=3093847 RepID=UPI0036D849EF
MIRAVVIALLLPTCALAQDEPLVRAADQDRLDAFDATAGAALLQALAGGRLGDVDLLQEVLSGIALAPLATSLPGEWACRTLKLGGDSGALVAYAPFDCTITADGASFVIEKASGSQRLSGRISLIDGQMILTGTGYVADTPPVPYADLPAENTSDGTLWPVVGIVTQPEPDRIRILMPKPVLESDLDILDLRRKPAPEAAEEVAASEEEEVDAALMPDDAPVE